MFGASAREFRYPGLLHAGEAIAGWYRYRPDDIYLGGLMAWCPWNPLVNQRFGDYREQEKISRHDIMARSCRMST
jgi:hypothetical protein